MPKSKLTVTIDRDLIPAAKRYARRRGVSLSSVIEGSLRDLTRADDGSHRTFAEKWRGAFALVDRDDARHRALVEKYG